MGSKGSKDKTKANIKQDEAHVEDKQEDPQKDKIMKVVENGDAEGMKALMAEVSWATKNLTQKGSKPSSFGKLCYSVWV